MRLEKIIWNLLVSLSLTNCANINRSEVGAVLGTTTTTASCVHMGVTDPYAIAGCAVVGAFAGAEIMYKSDYDVHNAVFVDHLNNGPSTQSYTNWYNQKSGNSGIIKISRSYIHNGFKCSDYSSTVNITDPYPMDKVHRSVEFGTACQLPDGRWQVIKEVGRYGLQ